MKSMRVLFAALVVGLAGCGDGGVQSPDFTPELLGLSLSYDMTDDGPTRADPDDAMGRRTVPAGRPVPLQTLGRFSAPPGTAPAPGQTEVFIEGAVSDASYTITPAGSGTVSNGAFVGTVIGPVTVTASKDDRTSNTLRFRVTEAVLESIAIDPPGTVTISVNETQRYRATGTFSDGMTRPVAVNWRLEDLTVGSFAPASGQTTVFTPAQDAVGKQTSVVASATSGDGRVVEARGNLNISDEFLVELTNVLPRAATVAPGATVEFVAQGRFSNGTVTREGEVSDSLLQWTSANPAIATIGIDTGVATGGTPGGRQTTVTATLKPTVTITGATRAVNATITVSDARCSGPLLESEDATTSMEIGPLCVGCSVTNQSAVIDGDISTFGTITVPVGLLTLGTATLNVDAASSTPDQPIGQRAGFVVALPAGLLTAEVLSSLTVNTRLGGVTATTPGASTSNTLRVSLLGAIGGQDAALVSFPAVAPFDGLALTFNGGLASLLPTVNVFQACATAVDSAAP